jgi:excisionase family DNA binding protein
VEDRLLRPREVAEQLACATSTVYKYIDNGLLAAVKIPAVDGKGKKNIKHLVRIKEKDLLLFIDGYHTGS